MFEGSVGMLDWSRILFSAFVESYIIFYSVVVL